MGPKSSLKSKILQLSPEQDQRKSNGGSFSGKNLLGDFPSLWGDSLLLPVPPGQEVKEHRPKKKNIRSLAGDTLY